MTCNIPENTVEHTHRSRWRMDITSPTNEMPRFRINQGRLRVMLVIGLLSDDFGSSRSERAVFGTQRNDKHNSPLFDTYVHVRTGSHSPSPLPKHGVGIPYAVYWQGSDLEGFLTHQMLHLTTTSACFSPSVPLSLRKGWGNIRI